MQWKKKTAAAAAALMLLLCGILYLPGRASGAENEQVLRLHILANSDGAGDQAVKLLVRDALLAEMPATVSAEAAEAYLLAHGQAMLSTVESVLRENGKPYKAQLMLGEFDFPERTYGDKVYPAGRYRALRVLLGKAEGKNWWCVLFPPLCIVTKEAEPLPEAADIEFESTLLNWLKGGKKEG